MPRESAPPVPEPVPGEAARRNLVLTAGSSTVSRYHSRSGIGARERLVSSGVLERVSVTAGPALAEEAETVAY
jgi:hypothetical protein